MKLVRWSMKDWLLRILSIILTLCICIVYFAFVGLSLVKIAADAIPIVVQEFDLSYYHVFGLFFSSWRFFCISFILLLSIFPQRHNIARIKISEKLQCAIKLGKLLTLWLKIIVIWVILKATRSAGFLPNPWSDSNVNPTC